MRTRIQQGKKNSQKDKNSEEISRFKVPIVPLGELHASHVA
jgi:hypothetical protein